MTTINNGNIQEFVRLYIQNRNTLPNDLQNILIGEWDVSNVTDMKNLFNGFTTFNEPLDQWDVGHVTDMSGMFKKCTSFNQPLNDWNVKVINVENMSNMFNGCRTFNQPLDQWDVSNVTDMSNMFYGCRAFNGDLNDWHEKLINVVNMSNMFSGCITFNNPLDQWSVNNVRDMSGMFQLCESFNQPLDQWTVNNVVNMSYMFSGCRTFNQPLDQWNIGRVNNMSNMFNGCTTFNKDLSNWNVSNINTLNMFTNTAMSQNNIPPVIAGEYEQNSDESESESEYESEPDYNEPDYNDSDYDSSEYQGSEYNDDDLDEPPVEHPPIVGIPLHMGEPVDILSNTDVNDIPMASNITANELPTYLEADHILFKQNNNLFLNSKDYIESQLNTNDISNSLVLICNNVWPSRLTITPDCLRDETIYMNLSKLGLVLGGYVRASEIKSVIDDRVANTGPPHIYVLTVDNATPPAPSVVSWSIYKGLDTDATSASHCQPGRDGIIYNISICTYTIIPEAHGKLKNKQIYKKSYKKIKKGKKQIKTRKGKKQSKTRKGKKQSKTRKGKKQSKTRKSRKHKH
jgi:surface protein